jgi:PIN domain nuclease of toxin-antitoxin system
MPDLVIDTQIAVWHFEDSPRLSNTARNSLNDAAQKGENILLSAISIVEIIYLIEKGRLSKKP